MLHLNAEQFALYERMAFIEKLDRSFCKQLPAFAELDDSERMKFFADGMFAADQRGFKTEKGLASYALAAYWLGVGFERKSGDLRVLLDSKFPEARKVYPMNEWVRAVLGNPENLALADEELKQAFFRTDGG